MAERAENQGKRAIGAMRIALAIATVALTACGKLPTGVPARAAATGTASAATLDAYYRNVNGLKGAALMKGLNTLVKANQKVYKYDEARDFLFGSVDDTTNTNLVIDVYCGREGKGVTDRTTAFHRGLNTEHTWPQSMGAKVEPAKSDMHHLFPVDSGTNSMRNNHPYGVPTTVLETLPDYLGDGQNSRFGKLADGTEVFEPRNDHKGDAARAMLYFYMRYGYAARAADGVKTDNFRKEFATLWRWHFTDLPSAKEKARNEAIYKLQKTRNPFVDHPEYVQRIGHFLAPGRVSQPNAESVGGADEL